MRREDVRMVKKTVTVQLKTGLRARPAALFVQEANKYSSGIFVEKEDKKVNAKSIMGIMSLAINAGSEITIIADGNDELQAVGSLENLLNKEE